MEEIAAGLEVLLGLETMAWLLFGVVAGFLAGVLPGFQGVNAAALVLPFAIGLPTASALVLIGGIYAGSMFSGSIPAILVNAPGEAGAAATALDGYPMAEAGKGDYAIGLARMASAAGGLLSGVVVLLIIGPLSELSLQFGSRELFAVAVLGIFVISTVIGDHLRKGLISALLGLLVASMSANPMTGEARFTLGFLQLYEDVPFVVAVIGLFAIAQMFLLARRYRLTDDDDGSPLVADAGGASERPAPLRRLRLALQAALSGVFGALRYPVVIVRSAVVGLGLGVIPGVGTPVATFISYSITKRWSKTPEQFGKGAPQGVISSEATDNAVASGSMVPTLTLGVPGSAIAAIILGSLYTHGIQPGPRLMTTHVPEVYALLLAMIVGSLVILPLGLLLAAPMSTVTRVPIPWLVPPILVLCTIGTFSMRFSLFDVFLAYAFGLVGFVMRTTGYPIIPMILAMILGPIAEENFLRALQLGGNSLGYFLDSGIALVLWSLVGLLVALNLVRVLRRRLTTDRSAVSKE